MSNPVIDHAERKQALDPKQSFIVQAPAGSGKTTVLTQRFLALLGQAVRHPEEIIALTFTRKAANEMRTRVMSALLDAQRETPVANPHEQCTRDLANTVLKRNHAERWQLLDNPNRLRIQTIDSLCASLTRFLPLSSGFGAPPKVSDDPKQLYREAIYHLFASLEHDQYWSPQLATLLLYLDNNLLLVENLLLQLLSIRDQWLPHLLGHDLEQLREQLEASLARIISETLQQTKPLLLSYDCQLLMRLFRFSTDNLGLTINNKELPGTQADDLATWQALAELLLTKEGNWRLTVNKNQGFPADKEHKETKQQMLDLLKLLSDDDRLREQLHRISLLPPANYQDQQWELLAGLTQLLPVLVAELKLVFQAHTTVDFIEIAAAAVSALGRDDSPTELALQLDYKIQHILVDEFQDTSITQYRLLERLTAGWQAGDGHSLFLVGDPMQSIYRFRQAEVGLFIQAQQHGIGQIPLKPLTLKVNFRSNQPVIAWFNEQFNDAMPSDNNISTGAISFTPSMPAPQADNTGYVKIHAVNDDDEQEAAQVIALTQQALSDTSGSVAILVRARTHIYELLPMLRAADIAYQAIEIESLVERTIIQDLLALTRALLHPADRVAWLAVMRAPWCGLTLADIDIIAGQTKPTIWQRLQQASKLRLSTDGKRRALQLAHILQASLANRRRMPLADWVKSTWLALNGPSCCDDNQDLVDAEQFFNTLSEVDHGSDLADFQQLEQRLTKLFAAANNDTNVRVQVLTIHKSKGLEFDTVIIPGINRRPANNNKPLLMWTERPTSHGQVDLVLAPIHPRSEKSEVIYDWLRREEQLKALHELTRLLYVATTRAKENLHLVGSFELVDDIVKAPTRGSLCYPLWNTIKDATQASILSNTEIAEAYRVPPTQHGQLRRLPSNWFHQQPQEQAALRQAVSPLNDLDLTHTRQIGTVLHQALCQLSQHSSALDHNTITPYLPYWRTQLRQLGLADNQLDQAMTTLTTALRNCLDDPMGQWLLKQHQDAKSEYALSYQTEDGIENLVIDRTFVVDGVRWIIDYKLSQPTHDNYEQFCHEQRERYLAQLERYAAAFRATEPKPQRFGLYFPLLPAWLELTTTGETLCQPV